MNRHDRLWGGAIKVYTTAREAYSALVDADDPRKFGRNVDAFHVAAAIGIRLGTTLPGGTGERREELLNVYTIDPDGILWTILSARHPEASGNERFEKLMDYADRGIRQLKDDFALFGNLQSTLDAILKYQS
jgi:hypothetical protein